MSEEDSGELDLSFHFVVQRIPLRWSDSAVFCILSHHPGPALSLFHLPTVGSLLHLQREKI